MPVRRPDAAHHRGPPRDSQELGLTGGGADEAAIEIRDADVASMNKTASAELTAAEKIAASERAHRGRQPP
jgi:hypothetical protein